MTASDNTSSDSQDFRTGFIAIVGRPNVGKSTLLNQLIGQKISIVSRKAQTTRHRITGILTVSEGQYIFVDTPGFQTRYRNALNRTMNRNVTQALAEVDVVVLVMEAERFVSADQQVLDVLPTERPVILVLNKIDCLRDKSALLPLIEQRATLFPFAEIIPLSAEKNQNVTTLITAMRPYLPFGEPLFSEDDITDRSERFLASEFLREKLFRLLGDELPYGMAVEIEKFENEGELRRIFAAIIVNKESHKGIVIGKKGEQLKRISSEARVELERLFQAPVYLEVWVKVRGGWADDERALKSLGY